MKVIYKLTKKNLQNTKNSQCLKINLYGMKIISITLIVTKLKNHRNQFIAENGIILLSEQHIFEAIQNGISTKPTLK